MSDVAMICPMCRKVAMRSPPKPGEQLRGDVCGLKNTPCPFFFELLKLPPGYEIRATAAPVEPAPT